MGFKATLWRCPTCGSKEPDTPTDCPSRWHSKPDPNNPGYRPEHKELEDARKEAQKCREIAQEHSEPQWALLAAVSGLAAEVRVMRLERALER